MSSLNMEMNATQLVSETMRMVESLGIAKSAMENFTVSQIKFNKDASTGEFTAMVNAVVDGNKKLQASLKETAGVWEGTAATIKTAKQAITKDAMAKTSPIVNQADTQRIINDITKAYGVQASAVRNLVVEEGKLRNTRAGETYTFQMKLQIDANKELQLSVQKLGNEYKILSAQMNTVASNRTSSTGIKGPTPPPVPTTAEAGGFGIDIGTVTSLIIFRQALMGVLNEIKSSAVEAREYNIQISLLRTLAQDNQSTFNSWNESIKEVSNSLGLSITDVAKGAYEALSNQVTRGADDTSKFLSIIGEFARTTNSTVEQSSNLFSSIIKGFQYDLSHTDEIAAKLFKTIDLGRVKAGDLANSIGRITPLANQLGISLEEVLASITTLTRSGVMPQNALTFMLNMMQKLSQPTEDMKNLFESWGTPTGEAAVSTFKFVGVLKKLEEVSKGSATEVSRLFNEMRGKQGFTGLTQNGFFQDFQSDLSAISSPRGEYENAKKIRSESAADVVNKQLNQIRNFFITLGEDFTKVLAFFNNNIGTLVGTVRLLTNTIIAGGVAWGAYAAYTRIATVANIAFGSSVVSNEGKIMKATDAAEGLVKTKTRLGGILSALGGPTGLIAIGAIGFGALLEMLRSNKKEIDGLEESLGRLRDAMQKTKTQGNEDQNLKQFNTLKTNVSGLFSDKLKATANDVVQIQKRILELKPVGEQINTDLAGSFKNYIDSINRSIQDYKTKITDARTAIKNSSKDILNFEQNLSDVIRQTQLQYADVYQKQQLRANFIQQLRSEADKLYATGKPEDSREADKKLVEAAKLQKEIFDQQQQFRIQQRREDIANYVVPADYNKVVVETTELQAFYNDLIKQQVKGQQTANEIREKDINTLTKQIDLEEERKKKIEIIAKELNEFSLTNKEGQIRPEFKNQVTGKLDQTKVQQFREQRIQSLKDLTKEGEGVDYFNNLQRQVEFIEREQAIRQELNDTLEKQNNLRNQEKTILREYEQNQTALRKAREELTGQQSSLKDLAGTLDVMQSRINTFSPSKAARELYKGGETGSFADKQVKRFDTINALDKQREEITNMIQGLQQKPPELITQKDIDDLQAKGTAYFKAYRDTVEMITGVNSQKVGQAVVASGARPTDPKYTIEDIEQNYKTLVAESIKSVNSLTQAKEKLKQFNMFSDLAADLNNLKQVTEDVSGKQIPQLNAGFDQFRGVINDINFNLEKMAEKITNMPTLKQGGGGDNLGFGGVMYEASGGYIAGHPGQPRGSDTIPAWLTPGEYVMPVQAVQRFRPQLEQMRMGVRPMYFNQGGSVTTHVGDIHMSLSGNESEDKKVISFGRKLNREIRRGNVILSRSVNGSSV